MRLGREVVRAHEPAPCPPARAARRSAPRTRAARRAVTLVFALNGALIGSWAVRIPAVKANLDLSDGTLGLALAAIAAGSLVAMPIAGWLSAAARQPRRPRA